MHCLLPGTENSSDRDDILTELSNALNRLQATLLDDKDAVTDTLKRDTILTLVAWLKKILQSPSEEISADTPIFSLTDLLPTELLLNKLMPQLTGNADGSSSAAERSASSKRFSRQRNKRFNTVGVSKEELADARLFFQKKLLSDTLASDATASPYRVDGSKKTGNTDVHSKSLNTSYTNKLSDEVERIIGSDSRQKTSKSIDIAPGEEHLYDTGLLPQHKGDTYAFPNRRFGAMRNIEAQDGNAKTNGYHNHNNRTGSKAYCDFTGSNGNAVTFDANTRDDPAGIVESKPMNKFTLRKMKIKRANTIDIPKKESEIADIAQTYTKAAAADTNFNRALNYHDSFDGLRRTVQANCAVETDKGKVPPFEPKTNSDLKFIAFMNKQPNENRLSWIGHNKVASPQLKSGSNGGVANNWTNKFDNIKNSFEKPATSQSVSPASMIKKNQFNHASTSPFIPVNSSKLPASCGPSPQHAYQTVRIPQVHKPIPSVATNYYINQQQNFDPKPKLQTQKSLPSTNPIKDDESYLRPKASKMDSRPNTWSTKYASMDNTTFNNVVNKLRSPVVDASMPPPVIDSKLNGNAVFSAQLPSSFNPLYVPLHQNGKQQMPSQVPSPNDVGVAPYGYQLATSKPTPPFPGLTPSSPQYSSPYQTPISPASQASPASLVSQASPNVNNRNTAGDFPKYTYTCTDYTRPACVSTYIPNEASPAPAVGPSDTNNLNQYPAGPRTVNQSPQAPPSKHNGTLVRADYNSSSEYLSDTNSSRSPQPYYTPVENIDNANASLRSSGEYTTAKAQVMKYPNSQTATVLKPRLHSAGDDGDEENARKLHSFLRQNVNGKRPDPAVRKSLGQLPNDYPLPIDTPDQTVFSQVNKSYVAPIPPFNPKNTVIPNNIGCKNEFSNFAPIEYKPQPSWPQHVTPPMRMPLWNAAPAQVPHPVPASVIEATELAKQAQAQSNEPIIHQQQPNVPAPNQQTIAQSSNRIYDSGLEKMDTAPVASARTKSSTGAVKVNSYGSQYMPPKVESDKNALWLNGCGPKPEKPTPAPRTQTIKSTAQPKAKNPDQPPPHPVKYQTMPSHVIMNNVSGRKPAEIKRKQSLPSDGTDFNTFMGAGSDAEEPRHNYLPTGVLQRSKSGHTLAIMKQFEAKERSAATSQSFKPAPLPSQLQQQRPPQQQPKQQQQQIQQQLKAPNITETPSTPTTEEPVDEFPQPGMVQHFIQSINNNNNKNRSDPSQPLQRSKSNHTLSLPKQYEGAMKKSEVMEKERTVAAYFGVQKSPSGLQRSSSQHNMIVRSSQQSSAFVTTEKLTGDTKLDLNSNDQAISDKNTSSASTTTTTTKSAHHLKILKRSQHGGSALSKSQTMPHISSIRLLDESNVDDAFEDLFKSFT